jgi:hypothetical protein
MRAGALTPHMGASATPENRVIPGGRRDVGSSLLPPRLWLSRPSFGAWASEIWPHSAESGEAQRVLDL